MLKNIVKKYAKNIQKSDIENFALNNKVKLKENELNTIYEAILYDIDEIINDADNYLLKIKDKLENTTYLKIKELISIYKDKYKDYL